MEDPDRQALDRERSEVLEQIEALLETPVRVLGFVWLALLVLEFLAGESKPVTIAVYAIWIIFVLDFTIRFTLAPHKGAYLRKNWLTVLSLAVPALRVFAVFKALRFLRVARAARGLRLVKVLGSLNRGMRALRAVMQSRGFGYVVILSAVVALVGAAGMYVFEGPPGVEAKSGQEANPAFEDYGDALWWTAMVLTTMGSDGWPQTVEGRVLGFLISLYAFAVFGYVTATLASFFIGREAASRESRGAEKETLEEMQQENIALREELQRLRDNQAPSPD